jgi:hypothetical protein
MLPLPPPAAYATKCAVAAAAENSTVCYTAASCSLQVGGCAVTLLSDSIHISRLPRHLTTPHAQLSMFASQLVPHNPAAAAACLHALDQHVPSAAGCSLNLSSDTKSDGDSSSSNSSSSKSSVWLSACFTYRLPDARRRHWLLTTTSSKQQQQQLLRRVWHHPMFCDTDGRAPHQPPAADGGDDDDVDATDWDAAAPWSPWAQQHDPISALELDVVWQDKRIVPAAECERSTSSSGSGAGGSSSSSSSRADGDRRQPCWTSTDAAAALKLPAGADHWLLHVVAHGVCSSPRRSGRLGVRSSERHRRHVQLSVQGPCASSSQALPPQIYTAKNHAGRCCCF